MTKRESQRWEGFHRTTLVSIGDERVPVDRRIARIVRWLNELPGVRTQYSCEGDDRNQPYVLFECGVEASLQQILDRTVVWVTAMDCIVLARVWVENYMGRLRYHLECPTIQQRDILLGRLKRGW